MTSATHASTIDVAAAVRQAVQGARSAAQILAIAPTEQKDRALGAMGRQLGSQREAILRANAQDVAAAKANGLAPPLLDRLTLTEPRFAEMVSSVEAVTHLPDPVGQIIKAWCQPNGIEIRKVRVPLGVVGIIYESRPNVTSDCATLCLKSGNTVVLRGGSEAFASNTAIAAALRAGLAEVGLPEAAVTLIRMIAQTSRIPVIKHAKGVCHVYVDDAADLEMAAKIVVNAKCQRPATCNAMETLLVHARVADRWLPGMLKALQEAGVELRGCERSRVLAPGVRPATEEDWSAEYLALILSVRVVDSLEQAIEHISRYGSAHSDAIVTKDAGHAARFTQAVDSAAVFVNASTRLSDGYQFGLGAEIGISTDRLHARGPMGLEELTTYKYVVLGTGQLRE